MSINRRDAIKHVAYLMGGTLSAPAIMGVLQGCAADAKADWTPTFFGEAQALTVQELAETIMPATDTLGAKDLGVPKFVEEMIATVYDEKARTDFMNGLAAFEKEIGDKFGKTFDRLTSEEKLAVAQEKNTYMQNPDNRPGRDEPTPFFWTMKQLTLLGYFTTEYGATKVLQYQLIPAEFNGCMPIEEAGEKGRTYAV